MTSRIPWGAYHASAQIDIRPPYFSWNSIPWLGFALLKLGPLAITLNWPVTFDEDDK